MRNDESSAFPIHTQRTTIKKINGNGFNFFFICALRQFFRTFKRRNKSNDDESCRKFVISLEKWSEIFQQTDGIKLQ